MKKLEKEGTGIKNLSAPDELRDRLSQTIKNNRPHKVRYFRRYTSLAAAFILMAFMIYHMDTLAFWSNQMLGYEPILSGTLERLNELESGQSLGLAMKWTADEQIILDKIMIDSNSMIAFYRFEGGSQPVNISEYTAEFSGYFKNYAMKSSVAYYDEEDANQIFYIAEFEVPKWFERALTFRFGEYNDVKDVFTFKIDRSQAMGHTFKDDLTTSWDFEDYRIHLTRIVSSPTQTIVSGKVDNWVTFVMKNLTGNRMRIENVELELIVDGEIYTAIGSSMTTNLKGIQFTNTFDALPDEIESYEIRLKSHVEKRQPSLKIPLDSGPFPIETPYESHAIVIEDIVVENGYTNVVLITDPEVKVYYVTLESGKETLPFVKTINDHVEGKRTLVFEGDQKPTLLKIRDLYITVIP